MKINELLTEDQLDEINWRKGLATAALGAAALGSMAGAQARVAPGEDPNINRLTGVPNTVQQIQQPANTSTELPNKNLDTAEKVERTDNGAVITYGGKDYNARIVPSGSPTPRGAKIIKVQQSQLGERGIGSYTTYLLPNGNAYIYR